MTLHTSEASWDTIAVNWFTNLSLHLIGKQQHPPLVLERWTRPADSVPASCCGCLRAIKS